MTDYQISMVVGAFFLLIALTLLVLVIQRPTEKEISDLRRDIEEHCKHVEARYKDGQI